jgi:hypothetical protein
MYLMGRSEDERAHLGKYFLVRVDVMSTIGDLGIA